MAPDSGSQRSPSTFTSIKGRYSENRDFDATASWREWFRERYARYWYGIGALILDVMVAGIILEIGTTPAAWQYVLSAVCVIGLAYLELKGFQRFWPPKPPV